MRLEGRTYRPRLRTRILFLLWPRRCDVAEPDPETGERVTEWRWLETARLLEERVSESVTIGHEYVGQAESWRRLSLCALKDIRNQMP